MTPYQEETSLMSLRRLGAGFGWGMVATLAMSVLMVIGVTSGVSPMPRPIPEAISSKVLGGSPQLLVLLLAVAGHLAYGGTWGAVLAALVRPATVWKGIALGGFLWLLMQIAVLPFLGWGLFGIAITPRIAGATLILHLVYGATLGWLLDRKESSPRRTERTVSEATRDTELRRIYEDAETIAVLGAHPDTGKPAHYVPAYLKKQGYRLLPVNPDYSGQELWDETVRESLADLDGPVDVVDVFRRSEALPDHLSEILGMNPRPGVVWLQRGIRNDEVAQELTEAGIDVVQDRCMYANHRRLYDR